MTEASFPVLNSTVNANEKRSLLAGKTATRTLSKNIISRYCKNFEITRWLESVNTHSKNTVDENGVDI